MSYYFDGGWLMENNKKLKEGFVDPRNEHIELFYREEQNPSALVAPSGDGTFTVHFLPNAILNTTRKGNVIKELMFYLIELDEPNPWHYAIYHTTTTADMYSDVHWAYYKGGRKISAKTRDVLIDIAQCKQACGIQSNFLPEPWNGWINRTPILFIASNPSVSDDEHSPTKAWGINETVDFFMNRFSPNGPWTKDYTKYRVSPEQPEQYSPPVPFWKGVIKLANDIIGGEETRLQPGVDYALTEVVHCKSKRESLAMRLGAKSCRNKYLEQIVNMSSARVIIVLGTPAARVFTTHYGLHNWPRRKNESLEGRRHLEILKNDKFGDKMVVFLRHPNFHGYRKLTDCLTPEEIFDLRAQISGF